MVKFVEKACDSIVLTVNFWIISRAVERAAERELQREDGLFQDYML